jgi:hypothetical protein
MEVVVLSHPTAGHSHLKVTQTILILEISGLHKTETWRMLNLGLFLGVEKSAHAIPSLIVRLHVPQ